MQFLLEVRKSEEFKKLQKENPLGASYLIKHLSEEWSLYLQHKVTHDMYRKQVWEINSVASNRKDGYLTSSIPAVIEYWLKEKAKINGSHYTKKDLMSYIKKHPEWWTTDKQ